MKFIAFTLTTLLSPMTVYAAASLTCAGKHIWYGEGQADTFTVTAVIEDSNTLLFLQENRNEEGDKAQFFYQELHADRAYKPNGNRYQGFNRFALDGGAGWTKYFLLLPKDLGSQPTAKGFIQRAGHDTYPTVRLKCDITGIGL